MDAGQIISRDRWKPVGLNLPTPWSTQVSPTDVHPEYPRPQFVRDRWQSLNGLWDFAVVGRDASEPTTFVQKILVPFPVEAPLSGVAQRVSADDRLWYRRSFCVPKEWVGRRIILHFDAVDWKAAVWVNGNEAGTHRGGYDRFSFDITDMLVGEGDQEIVLSAWDPTTDGDQPRGKQAHETKGVWYTSTSGIWQSVWIEPVPAAHLEGVKIAADMDNHRASISFDESTLDSRHVIEVSVFDDGKLIDRVAGRGTLDVTIPNPKLWTPESPFLYDLVFVLRSSGDIAKEDDVAKSYFGMRKISVRTEKNGHRRFLLNDEPTFMYGPLDQGYWPDGIYTAPTDDALKFDIELTKKLGFNTIRKHIKVEPDRWYYWCDKLGVIVWQDIVSGDAMGECAVGEITRTEASATQHESEMLRTVDGLRNHPSIVMWVVFNEAWGQYDTMRVTKLVEDYDPTRLANSASGWSDMSCGSVLDVHVYPGPGSPIPDGTRVSVLGECGGYGLKVADHLWRDDESWGYRDARDSKALTARVVELAKTAREHAVATGLCAVIYTQTTDVEVETNGLATYDRQVVKVDVDQVAAAHRETIAQLPQSYALVEDALIGPISITNSTPTGEWQFLDYDDSHWDTRESRPSVVPTPWSDRDDTRLFSRRHLRLRENVDSLRVRIWYTGKGKVFVNGYLVLEQPHYAPAIAVLCPDRCGFEVGDNIVAAEIDGGLVTDVVDIDVVDTGR